MRSANMARSQIMESRRRRSLITNERRNVFSFRFSVSRMGSRSYKDLVVWQKSIAPSQMKRAAVSVASNIAEGQARQHLGEFRQFLAMANGSLAELDTQRIIAEELGLINRTRSGELDCAITEIRKMLYSLSSKAQPIAKN